MKTVLICFVAVALQMTSFFVVAADADREKVCQVKIGKLLVQQATVYSFEQKGNELILEPVSIKEVLVEPVLRRTGCFEIITSGVPDYLMVVYGSAKISPLPLEGKKEIVIEIGTAIINFEKPDPKARVPIALSKGKFDSNVVGEEKRVIQEVLANSLASSLLAAIMKIQSTIEVNI
jgi:hypothetical protein